MIPYFVERFSYLLLILALALAFTVSELEDQGAIHRLTALGVRPDVADCMVRLEFSQANCELGLRSGVWVGPDSVAREYPPARMAGN